MDTFKVFAKSHFLCININEPVSVALNSSTCDLCNISHVF